MEEKWFNKNVEETTNILETNIETGLKSEQLEEKIKKYRKKWIRTKEKEKLNC